MTLYIAVPDENDSLSRVTLSGKEYLIRFTYNAKYDFWSFGIYDLDEQPILAMTKIVPLSPLLHFYIDTNLPNGIFGCFTNLKRVGRNDFLNGKAEFAYIPNEDLDGWEVDSVVR